MRKTSLLSITAVLFALYQPVSAQQAQMGTPMHTTSEMQNMSPFHKETMAAMDKMNKAMMQGMMDQDPGLAWMKSMSAHHQGAIDMSEIVLKHTKDSDVTREARKTAQENEKDLKALQERIQKENKKN